MAVAYATPAQLAEYLSAEAVEQVAEAERLLMRASDLLDEVVRAPFRLTLAGLPEDAAIAAAMRDACCAQVEFWAEVGEDHDVSGLARRQVSIGALSLAALPPEVAPRARRILVAAGLMTIASPGALLPEVSP